MCTQAIIRPMDAGTLARVAAVEQACFSEPWSLKSLSVELSNPLAVFLTAELDGEVAGYAGMHCAADEGYIANIAVLPQYRRRGAARALVQALLDYALAHSLSFVTLEVRPSNAAAISLYGGMGFRPVGTRRGYYKNPPEDALLMTRYM